MHPVKSVRALRFLGMLSLEDDTILDLSIQLKKNRVCDLEPELWKVELPEPCYGCVVSRSVHKD